MSGLVADSNDSLAYDRIAQVYLGTAGSPESQRKAKARIDWLALQVAGEQILDIGCSEGILPILLGQKNYHVDGVDINPQAIAYANNMLLNEQSDVQDRVRFFCSDLFAFDANGKQYDTVIVGEVIEHFHVPELVIQKAFSFLKPGGTLIVTTPFGYFPDPDHRQTFTLRSFLRIFRNLCTPVLLSVVDGYIRFVAHYQQPGDQDWSLYSNEYLLALTEQAALAEQERYRKLLDTQVNETRSVHTERKRLEAENQKQQRDLNETRDDLEQTQHNLEQTQHNLQQTQHNLDQTLGELGKSRTELDQALGELGKSRTELDQVLGELTNSRAELNKSRIEIDRIRQELNQSKSNLQKVLQDLKQTRSHLTYYMDQFSRYRDAFLDMEGSVSYRIGNSLKLAVKKPGRNTILLPYTMGKLFVAGVKRVLKRRAESPKTNIVVQPLLPVVNQPALAEKKSTDDNKNEVQPPEIRKKKAERYELDPSVKKLQDLKVACIMDAFTFNSYAPECNIKQLTPDNWRVELESFQPHLLFIESAWQGVDKLWYRQVDRCSQQVRDVIDWCNQKGIPTVFWNKEDPIHFDSFIRTAGLFDFIFTTDIDTVRKYKSVCGTNNAFLLPFAAQPRVHNPIEKYDRKKTFCFAGAYYARYPERQRDFDAFANVIAEKWGLDIYDRNQFPDNTDYMFPERYRKYILGSLPPEKIDLAYKGYRFGINMNSIKQSQTMFARRVFELLASNTVTVSNYSRGVRNIFGDLVITTDDENRLSSEVDKVAGDELYYRKYRLAGMRKVMLEETYHDRLAYIVRKVFGADLSFVLEPITVFSQARTEKEAQKIISAFDRQKYAQKKLALVVDPQLLSNLSDLVSQNVTLLTFNKSANQSISEFAGQGFAAIFSPFDYYGANYLLDMSLSTRYISAPCVGKCAFYKLADEVVGLSNDGQQYRFSDEVAKRAAIIRVTTLEDQNIASLLQDAETGHYELPGECFSVDEFNYCQNFDGENSPDVDDLVIADQGISSLALMEYAETLCAAESNLFEIAGENLKQAFADRKGEKYDILFRDQTLDIASKLHMDKHDYIYSNQWIRVADLRLDNDSTCLLSMNGILDVQLTVLWHDEKKAKLGALMVKPGITTSFQMPEGTAFVRLALRIKGSGHCSIKTIRFSKGSDECNSSWISKSNLLLVTNHYPSYDNLYRNAFVHRRIVGYKSNGLLLDVLRMNAYHLEGFEEFQGVDVVSGSSYALERALASGHYTKVLVHFLDEEMWKVLKKYLDRVKLITWIHGSEIQPWWRREFNFTSAEDKDRAVSESVLRQSLWNEVFASDQSKLHYVFVSNYFANEIAQDYSLNLDNLNYSIIHNFIDTELFSFHPKTQDHRKRLLSVRPFANRKYANDLTVKTILELSSKPFFNDLDFRIIGDGCLFDETVAPLRGFKNVTLEKRFLTQEEIAALHKEYGIFITPTRMDAQGVSRDEAMASGLVPLTNAVAAIPEFADETCAILAPEESYLELAKGIEYLYEHPEDYLKMSQVAAERVKKQSSFTNTIEREVDLVKDQGE